MPLPRAPIPTPEPTLVDKALFFLPESLGTELRVVVGVLIVRAALSPSHPLSLLQQLLCSAAQVLHLVAILAWVLLAGKESLVAEKAKVRLVYDAAPPIPSQVVSGGATVGEESGTLRRRA
jgi:hypothetical protein